MRIIFFFLLLTQLKSFAAETITYDMFLWGNKIGSMTITKTDQEDGSELYVLDSHLKAKVLWITRENTAHMETVFKNGKMISSYQKEMEDGKVKRWNRVTFDGAKYSVDGYKGKSTFSEQPVFAVGPLYFKGLVNVPRLFYEAEAEFCNVEKVEEDT